jgi:hypothetical protein
MANAFDYDWFSGAPFTRQKDQARQRCARKRFAHVPPDQLADHQAYQTFLSELEVRTLVYLRDGFSYELKELVDLELKGLLTFECEPVDEHYKVGAFIVSMLYEEIVRVENFAVHPSEKPEDVPLITGFRTSPHAPPYALEPAPPRDEARE